MDEWSVGIDDLPAPASGDCHELVHVGLQRMVQAWSFGMTRDAPYCLRQLCDGPFAAAYGRSIGGAAAQRFRANLYRLEDPLVAQEPSLVWCIGGPPSGLDCTVAKQAVDWGESQCVHRSGGIDAYYCIAFPQFPHPGLQKAVNEWAMWSEVYLLRCQFDEPVSATARDLRLIGICCELIAIGRRSALYAEAEAHYQQAMRDLAAEDLAHWTEALMRLRAWEAFMRLNRRQSGQAEWSLGEWPARAVLNLSGEDDDRYMASLLDGLLYLAQDDKRAEQKLRRILRPVLDSVQRGALGTLEVMLDGGPTLKLRTARRVARARLTQLSLAKITAFLAEGEHNADIADTYLRYAANAMSAT